MRELDRIDRIIDLVCKIWLNYPDMRYGQLYESLLSQYANDRGLSPFVVISNMWNLEDTDFEVFLKNFKGFGK